MKKQSIKITQKILDKEGLNKKVRRFYRLILDENECG